MTKKLTARDRVTVLRRDRDRSRRGRNSGAGYAVHGIGQFAAIQAVAPALGVDLTPVDARDAVEIERAITAFARSGKRRPDRERRARF